MKLLILGCVLYMCSLAAMAQSPVKLSNTFQTFNSSALKKCDDSLASLLAAPCNGVSVTPIVFNAGSRSVASGTGNTVGVVYRYANAGTAPDGTVLDALVTVINYANNQDNIQTNFRDADISTVGFDQNLQPSINQESGTFANGGTWQASITYRIRFVVTGTNTPKVISVAATSIDNDGSAICGGLRESVTYSATPNQLLTSTTTNQVISGNALTPNSTATQTGIGTGIDFASAALYINISELDWTYSFATAGNCTAGGNSEVRYGSLNMNCQITFDRTFASVGVSGNVYNDPNGLTDSTVGGTGTGTPGGAQLYANLIDANGFVVSSVAVGANGAYSFATVVAGSYTIQLSTNQGVESSAGPALALPAGWVNTGENLGSGAGSDGSANGSLAVTVASTNVINANFAIEQRPTANNNTAASQNNPGGATNVTVSPTLFTATDSSGGTISSLRITAFPLNAASITINGTSYTAATFPAGGVSVPTNASGNPTQAILVDPIDGAMTVGISYRATDNAGFESNATATASLPFTLAPTSSNALISGKLMSGEMPIGGALVVLLNTATGDKRFIRTDLNGVYTFEEQVGETYLVQPLSSKYSFAPLTKIVNLLDDVTNEDFAGTAKNYRPRNDFDGDGKSDAVVYRASEGNWYVLRSSDREMSVFHFGVEGDIPVSADFDGDGKTDYAIFRPEEGNWYIWESAAQTMRVERFGLAGDTLLPADYDGDGKADTAVFRAGVWFVRNSSNGEITIRQFGLADDLPSVADFDGDTRADISVYRPSDGNWYVLDSSNNNWMVYRFGLAADVQIAGDYDGDGRADIAQFREGVWYILASTTDFQANQFGAADDESVVGDFDGDGRIDLTVFRKGSWSIRQSANGEVEHFSFGLPTDILVK